MGLFNTTIDFLKDSKRTSDSKMEFRFKCNELLRMLPSLQCCVCGDVPGPDRKNRYTCFDESHVLCERHKTRCGCGSRVGRKPSEVLDKLLQGLPWMCQNYLKDCREIRMNVEDLNYHQQNCIFRPVFCPNSGNCQEKVVLFKDISDHLAEVHFCKSEWKSQTQVNKWNPSFLLDFIKIVDGTEWFTRCKFIG